MISFAVARRTTNGKRVACGKHAVFYHHVDGQCFSETVFCGYAKQRVGKNIGILHFRIFDVSGNVGNIVYFDICKLRRGGVSGFIGSGKNDRDNIAALTCTFFYNYTDG